MHDVTLFERAHGPICYQAPILHRPSPDRVTLPDELLSSGLDWLWYTYAHEPLVIKPFTPLLVRPLTMLSSENPHALLRHMRARDIEGNANYIALFGLVQGSAQSIRTEDSLQKALSDFSAFEHEPIQLVVTRIGDSYRSQLFVPHNPSAATSRLMDIWDVRGTNTKIKTRPYRHLYLAQLEKQFNLPVGRQP